MKIIIFAFLSLLYGCASSPPRVYDGEVISNIAENLDRHNVEAVSNLMSNQFDALVSRHEDLKLQMENDFSAEKHLSWEIYSVYATRNNIEKNLDRFVSSRPDSYIPYLYRAALYYGKGHRARGYKFSAETRDNQREDMRFYFDKALLDLSVAKRINPRSLHAHILSAQIKKFMSEMRASMIDDVSRAFELSPESYDLWEHVLLTSLPRWLGSHQLLRQKYEEMAAYYETNPRLKNLEALLDYDIGFQAQLREEDKEAIDSYKKSLSKGDSFRARHELTVLLSYMGNDNEACQINEGNVAIRPFYWFANTTQVYCKKIDLID